MYSLSRLSIARRSVIGMQNTSAYGMLTHDKKHSQFYMQFNSHIAVVEYEKYGNVLDLVHSEVPGPLRGRGSGTILAKATFDFIKANNLKMKLSCSFLRRVYEENKSQYSHILQE